MRSQWTTAGRLQIIRDVELRVTTGQCKAHRNELCLRKNSLINPPNIWMLLWINDLQNRQWETRVKHLFKQQDTTYPHTPSFNTEHKQMQNRVIKCCNVALKRQIQTLSASMRKPTQRRQVQKLEDIKEQTGTKELFHSVRIASFVLAQLKTRCQNGRRGGETVAHLVHLCFSQKCAFKDGDTNQKLQQTFQQHLFFFFEF